MFGKSKLKAQIKELSMKVAYLERAVAVRDKDNERLKDKLAESERKRLTPPASNATSGYNCQAHGRHQGQGTVQRHVPAD
ncbi:hypothetical protein [Salmonella phage ST17]|nr:hypothetical protein [Salmonella phage ST17]